MDVQHVLRKRSLTEQATILFVGHFVALLFGIAVPIVLVRVFPRVEYGLYQQLFLIFTTLFPIGQLGVTQGIYYFLPREPERKDALVVQTFLFVVAAGFVCLVLLLFFKGSIAKLMNNPQMISYIPVMAIYIFLMIVSSCIETIMIAEGRSHLSTFVKVISEFVRSLTVVVIALATRSIFSIFVALTFFALGRCIYQWVYLRSNYRLSLRNISIPFWRTQFAYSIPIGFANVAFLIQDKLHSLFVTFLFTPAIFATYAVGTYNLPFIGLITSSVSSVMVPELARCQKEGDTSRIHAVWGGSLRKMNIFFFPLFVFFFIMAHEFIVFFFTDQYLESVNIFRLSLFSILISGLNAGAILNAYAETSYQMKLAFLRIPVACVVMYCFIQVWGVHGAVAANVVVFYLFRFFIIVKAANVLGVSFRALLLFGENLRIMVAALIAAIPIVVVQSNIVLSPLFMLMVNAVLFLFSFCIAGFGLKIATRSEIDSLRGAIIPRFCSGKY